LCLKRALELVWPSAREEKKTGTDMRLYSITRKKYTLPTVTASLKPKVKADPTIILVYKVVCNKVGRVN